MRKSTNTVHLEMTWLIWSWPDCFYKMHRKGNLYQMQTKHCSCSIRKDVPSWKVRKAGDFTWWGTSTSSLQGQTRTAALQVHQLDSSAFWQTPQLLIHTKGKTSLGKLFLPTIEIFYYFFHLRQQFLSSRREEFKQKENYISFLYILMIYSGKSWWVWWMSLPIQKWDFLIWSALFFHNL